MIWKWMRISSYPIKLLFYISTQIGFRGLKTNVEKYYDKWGQPYSIRWPHLSFFYLGWGAGIRTPIGRSRVGSPTVERHPNAVSEKYDTLTLKPCQPIIRQKAGLPLWQPGRNVTAFELLVRKRLSSLFASSNNRAPFEAEPVDSANNEENCQREFKNRNFINEGDIG